MRCIVGVGVVSHYVAVRRNASGLAADCAGNVERGEFTAAQQEAMISTILGTRVESHDIAAIVDLRGLREVSAWEINQTELALVPQIPTGLTISVSVPSRNVSAPVDPAHPSGHRAWEIN